MSGLLLATASGCAGTPLVKSPNNQANTRAFDVAVDTFAYPNELAWEYGTDPVTSQIITQQNGSKPTFVHRCFAVSRMARQFFQYARFDPASPEVDDETYRKAIGAIVSRTPGDARRDGKVAIAGYADLRSFSQAKESLLKDASGGSWRSYFAFSNWRMVFPFRRSHQAATARQLLAEVNRGRLPIAHLIRFSPFPVTKINHVIVIVDAIDTAQETRFHIYDPNYPGQQGLLSFDHASRTFSFPMNDYFAGGTVDVYEIYGNELN